MVISLSGYAQTKPISIRVVSDSTTALGRSFSKNTLILNEQNNTLWKILALTNSGDALEDVSKALIIGTNVMADVPWGSVTGDISNQIDLMNLFSGKSDVGHTHDYGTLTNRPTIPTNTGQITENGNLYFTPERSRETLLTGLSLGSSSNIVSSDNFLEAFGKLQAQITALSVGGGTGDMLKSDYDTDNDQIADNAEALNGQAPAFYLNYSNFTNTPNLSIYLQDAPSDGNKYGRQDGGWVTISEGGGGVDWTQSGQGTIHSSNYVDQNTTYTAGAGLDLTAGVFSTNLTSTEIPNLGTTKITTGVFADARIAESNVTQHASALTITRSQISNYVYQPLVIQFEADGTVYIPIHENITYNLVTTYKTGTGTVTFEKNNSSETGSTSFAATDVLEVIATGVSGYVSITIPRTN